MWRPLFSTDGAWGAIRGGAQINVFGRADNIGAGEVDIIDNFAAPYYFSPTPEFMKVESDSGLDVPGGTGLRQVRIIGLPAWNEKEIVEDIAIGDTSVNKFVAINWMGKPSRLAEGESGAGVTGVNQGTVTAKTDPGAVEAARILPTQNTTHQACVVWPAGYRFYIAGYYATLNKSTGPDVIADLSLWINREPDNNPLAFYKFIPRGVTESSALDMFFNPYAMVDGPCVLKMRCDPSAAGADISAGLFGYLKQFPSPPSLSTIETTLFGSRARGDFF